MSASVWAWTRSASSLTDQVLIWTPILISASVLSPSVTATKRMLSPKRATRMFCVAWRPAAARTQVPTRSCVAAWLAWPETVVRGIAMRVSM